MSEMKSKRAVVQINPRMLADILKFPQDVEIHGVTWDHRRKLCEIHVEGDGLPAACLTPFSNPAPLITPIYSEENGNVILESWK